MDIFSAAFFASQLDWIIIAVVAVLISLECFRAGPARAISIALSFPLALLLRDSLSNAAYAGPLAASLTTPVLQAALFGILFGGSFFLVYRMTYSFDVGSPGLAQAILCGAAATAVIVAVWIMTPVLQDIWHFGPNVQSVFGAAYRLWWLLAAYFALAFARG
ncbi:hypothetical protein HY968_01620 [Candidatus Kaiserbacteria bacterium]|nr:hypothetical protein [Candidatus Kaiserbacteria bacterium]